jgi:thiosulfate/3-mercaptopyruvate sulfurtransferase
MTNSTIPSQPLVSIDWLVANMNHPDLIILEASLPKPGTKQANQDVSQLKIKNARIFDIENTFSDTNSPLPHTMPTPAAFTEEAQKLGINQDSIIVVYDNIGVYSSPRAWWMFRSMGHQAVFVLNGGLPAWKQAGFDCEPLTSPVSIKKGNFIANYQANLISNVADVLEAIQDENKVVIDARAEERFLGEVAEPREGLRRGHIPNSANIPFAKVQNANEMLEKPALEKVFEAVADKEQSLIFSCGSGVTACILALGAEIAGYSNISVYDGSWSEWGIPSDLPVES